MQENTKVLEMGGTRYKYLTLLFGLVIIMSGCASSKPSLSNGNNKTYTIEELEDIYRSMEKRPENFASHYASLGLQEREFNAKLRKTFMEIDSYKKKVFIKDRAMMKKEERERRKAKIARIRKDERIASEHAVIQKNLIDAYY